VIWALQWGLRQIFRIGTVLYTEGLWRMRRHGPVIAHCTDSEDFPGLRLHLWGCSPFSHHSHRNPNPNSNPTSNPNLNSNPTLTLTTTPIVMWCENGLVPIFAAYYWRPKLRQEFRSPHIIQVNRGNSQISGSSELCEVTASTNRYIRVRNKTR